MIFLSIIFICISCKRIFTQLFSLSSRQNGSQDQKHHHCHGHGGWLLLWKCYHDHEHRSLRREKKIHRKSPVANLNDNSALVTSAPDLPLPNPLLPTLGWLRQASYSPSLSKTWLAHPWPGCFPHLPTPGWLPHLLAPGVWLPFLPTPGWLRQGTPGASPTSVCVWLRMWLDATSLQTSFSRFAWSPA